MSGPATRSTPLLATSLLNPAAAFVPGVPLCKYRLPPVPVPLELPALTITFGPAVIPLDAPPNTVILPAAPVVAFELPDVILIAPPVPVAPDPTKERESADVVRVTLGIVGLPVRSA